MLYQIDPQSKTVPIFEQIVGQVIFGIASGSLAVGELIASIRELAERLTVHPNTVAKAYTELERKGLITALRGKGMVVTPEAPALARRQRHDILRRRVADVLREALTAFSPDEVRHLVNEELNRLAGEP